MQIGVDSSRAVENKRLFVVDNDEVSRMVLTYILHDENETHDLPSLEAAYQKAIEWKPDLLLLGREIVREKGVSVIAAIKADMPGIKVLLIAESSDDPLAAECLQAGVDGVVAKPLAIEPVRRKVDALLGRKRQITIPLHAI
jgi:CheY-like chemotaxis protein